MSSETKEHPEIAEIEWIDDYHKQVRDKLLPYLGCNDEDQVARRYLLRETEPIENVGEM